jgi:glycosyltransferase involved in cell wall biosynthesis
VNAETPPSADIDRRRALTVVHVIVGLEIGGAELTLYRLVTGSDPGISHVVISLTTEGAVGARLRTAGVEVHALHMKHAFDTPLTVFRLRRLLRGLSPNIVQTWMYHADFVGALAVCSTDPWALIWSVRSSGLSTGSRVIRLLQKACAWFSPRKPDLVLFASDLARHIHTRLGYNPKRSLVIRNGFEIDRFRPAIARRADARDRFCFAENQLVVGWVGRAHIDKHLDAFLAAASDVAQKVPEARFMVVGPGLDERNARLALQRDAAGLKGRMVLAGRQEDPVIAYAAMDVFCLSSRREAFPNVLGEAMASALPCVATDVGDVRVLLGHGDLIVPAEDVEALAERLLEVCRMTGSEREALGVANRERVVKDFDIAKTYETYADVYQRLLRALAGCDIVWAELATGGWPNEKYRS